VTRLVAALAALLALAGCGGAHAQENPVSESDAYELVESYVRRAVTALPDARLEAAAQPTSVACKGEPRGRVIVSSTYWVRGLADENVHFDTMLRWWEAHEFELLDDLRPERHYVWVQSSTDRFRMSLRGNEHGELLLIAESPCVQAG
jgi:hypothetical protein